MQKELAALTVHEAYDNAKKSLIRGIINVTHQGTARSQRMS